MYVMALAYVEKYGLGGRREVEYSGPLVNPRTGCPSRSFGWAGKIDGVARNGERLVVIEDKFVGNIQRAMIDRLPLDEQACEYVSACQDLGYDAEVWYRHTRVPGINPSKGKTPEPFTPSGKPSTARHVPAETLEEFEARLADDVAERPEFYFDEQRLVFPTEQMDEYRRERWSTAKSILAARRAAEKHGHVEGFPRNPSRCWEYGGCAFIPLCTAQPGAEDLT